MIKTRSYLLWAIAIAMAIAIVVFLAARSSRKCSGEQSADGNPVKEETLSACPVTRATACYGGLPAMTSLYPYSIQVLTNSGFITGYSSELNSPVFTAFHLPAGTRGDSEPDASNPAPDPRTSGENDPLVYKGTDFDAGKLAPGTLLAHAYGQKAIADAAMMSNLVPMTHELEKHGWRRVFEMARKYADRFDGIWVITGPTFTGPEKVLNPSATDRQGRIHIPSSCFAVFVRKHHGKPDVMAVNIPQAFPGWEKPESFLTTVSHLEQVTGLNFFPMVPEEVASSLENAAPSSPW